MDLNPAISRYMVRALQLARSGLGAVSPNPSVGAVVVNQGKIVGEGVTQPPGGYHAEIMALKAAGDRAVGATMYVTLEPCAHHGRTPPCADALVASGIQFVHIATIDPDPRTNGNGIKFLESKGLEVRVGEGSEDAQEIIEAFTKYSKSLVPYFSAKFAMSLDGKIATRTGVSKWITCSDSRERAHFLRSQSDAIMIGVGTAIADNPLLTVRSNQIKPTSQPLRVIIDTYGRLPLTSALLKEPGRTIVATSEVNKSTKKSLQDHGAEILELPRVTEGVDLNEVANFLGEEGKTSVLVEGGAALLGSLFTKHMIDKVYAFIAPMLIGGVDSKSPIGGLGSEDLSEALKLTKVQYEKIDQDILVIGYVK